MALIAQLGEHCTGIAEVVGSNPAQSLKIFSALCSSSVTAALALMTVITQLLLWDKLLLSVECSTTARRSRLFFLCLRGSFFVASCVGSDIVGTLHEMTSIFPESVFLRSCSLKYCEHILGSFRVLNFSSALRQNTSHFLRSF